MRRSIIALTVSVGLLATPGVAQAADDLYGPTLSTHATSDIGTAEWWGANVPFKPSETQRSKGKKITWCGSDGYSTTVGADGTVLTKGFWDAPRKPVKGSKKVRVLWVDGGTKKVKVGKQVCQLGAVTLQPSSVSELSTWTFAQEGSDLHKRVFFDSPPLETCTQAQLPASIEPQFIRADFLDPGEEMLVDNGGVISLSTTTPQALDGFYDVRWVINGGQGTYRYPTYEMNDEGVMTEVRKTTQLTPESTTVVTGTYPLLGSVMTSAAGQTAGFASQIYGFSVGTISADCGEDFLPTWSFGYTDAWEKKGQLEMEGRLSAVGSRDNISLTLKRSNVPTPAGQ